MGKKKSNNYHHNHNPNPIARESNERRLNQLQLLEVKRLQKLVEKQENDMRRFIPYEKRKKVKIDKNYDLKGAARPAREYYIDPNYEEEPEPINLMDLYDNNMWEHSEGQILLEKLLDYGIGLHNIAQKSKDAIKIFERILSHDPSDHLLARRALLRCYLDIGYAQEARDLIENRFSNDHTACFNLAKVLIEYVAFQLLKEEGSTELEIEEAMDKAVRYNPYILWVIIYHSTFNEAVEHLDEMSQGFASIPPGGPLEALQFFYEDFPIWLETEGIVDWVKGYVESKRIPFPPEKIIEIEDENNDNEEEKAEEKDDDDDEEQEEEEVKEEEKKEQSRSETKSNNHGEVEIKTQEELKEMYIGMYQTAIDMIVAGIK